MKTRLMLNLNMLGSTVAAMLRAPFSSFLSMAVIGIALALPAGIYVLLQNAQLLSKNLTGLPQISLFLERNLSNQDLTRIETLLKQQPQVQSYRFIPKSAALQQLKASAGLADIADSLEQNPLPDAFIVTARDFQSLEGLRSQMAKWPKVEHAQLDSAWIRKLDSFLKLGHVLALILTVLLGVALVFITFNTIRLQILTQRDEIEVAKLIGATNSFIRRPFLYLGLLQGLMGGAAAWSIVAASLYFINGSIAELAELYGSNFVLQNLPPSQSAMLLAFSAALGWLGAWISVSRHLWRIDSN